MKKTNKIDADKLEKFAKEKNIDKDKIEKIASSYQGKSENELIDELIKIGKNLKGKEEVVSKFKELLDKDQQEKLDSIMSKISDAEIQDKIKSKKGGSKSSSHSHSKSHSKSKSKSKSQGESKSQNESKPAPTTHKKTKRIKKIKKD